MNHAQKRAAAQAIPFHLPFPRRICCSSHQPSAVSGQPHRCLRCCFCFCLSGCHSRRESAVPRRPQPLPTSDHRERPPRERASAACNAHSRRESAVPQRPPPLQARDHRKRHRAKRASAASKAKALRRQLFAVVPYCPSSTRPAPESGSRTRHTTAARRTPPKRTQMPDMQN